MKNRPWIFLVSCLFLISFYSCKQAVDAVIDHGIHAPKKGESIKYTIPKGQHYSTQDMYESVTFSELKFTASFDSSAIYQTSNPANQEDINKLYGFSDNNADHQQFSARFGWNWTRGALRLYAYVYNNGERTSQEVSSIEIGQEYTCSIRASGSHYVFSANGATVDIPRASTTAEAVGYKLFPYFGGDETAPHEIDILIKEL